MKKHIVFSSLLFLLCFEALCQTGCQNEVIPNQGFYLKQAQYYCHQYVKAALIGNFIDMNDGKPKQTANESQFATLYQNAIIAGDPDFIRVCSISDAKAVCPSPGGDTGYHSAIILNNGIFASTPSASTNWLFHHQGPRAFTTACPGEEQYFAPIPNIQVSGSSGTNQGMTITLTLANNGQPIPSFLQLADTRWEYSTTYFSLVTKSATSITLMATNTTGYSDVKYKLVTGCNGTTFFRTKTVQVMPNCLGTLNGGPLYTFNTVPSGANQIVMYLSNWTWVKTSGNATWSTSNGGKNMTFTVSSGCATFNAYNANCNLTFTFCKGSSYSSFTVIDMKTLRVLREGTVENLEETNALLDGLPAGTYVIKIDGSSIRYEKLN